jgi:pimeloyl-ACP methyl ester carboxylesterase
VSRVRCPLLLLPGSLCDARLFAAQLAALRPRPVRVGDLSRSDSVAAMATAILRAAPPRFALAGLSMGAIVAFEIWRRAPGRVAGLAVFDSTCRAESPEVAARRASEIERIRREGTAGLRRLVRESYLPRYFAARIAGREPLHDLVVQMAAACGPAVLQRQWRALMGRPDSRATLATVDVPALVACGAEDALCPPALHEEMAAALGVHCHVLDGAGHLASLEAPERVSRLLGAWLERLDEREWSTDVGRHDVAC